jgi:chorismate dehydratase
VLLAKIDYINLLPFYVFIKKHSSSRLKGIINHHKSYPAEINQKFLKRKIDGAFISSIASKKSNSLDIGIVAKKDVMSVLLIPGEYAKDKESASSNMLARVLEQSGQVIIGDKALQYFYQNSSDEFVDLAKKWNEKYNLPFVFARLCYNKHGKKLDKLSKKFVHTKVKIPSYIMKKYVKRSSLTKAQIEEYLTKISYKIEQKEKKSLHIFFKKSKKFL